MGRVKRKGYQLCGGIKKYKLKAVDQSLTDPAKFCTWLRVESGKRDTGVGFAAKNLALRSFMNCRKVFALGLIRLKRSAIAT